MRDRGCGWAWAWAWGLGQGLWLGLGLLHCVVLCCVWLDWATPRSCCLYICWGRLMCPACACLCPLEKTWIYVGEGSTAMLGMGWAWLCRAWAGFAGPVGAGLSWSVLGCLSGLAWAWMSWAGPGSGWPVGVCCCACLFAGVTAGSFVSGLDLVQPTVHLRGGVPSCAIAEPEISTCRDLPTFQVESPKRKLSRGALLCTIGLAGLCCVVSY